MSFEFYEKKELMLIFQNIVVESWTNNSESNDIRCKMGECLHPLENIVEQLDKLKILWKQLMVNLCMNTIGNHWKYQIKINTILKRIKGDAFDIDYKHFVDRSGGLHHPGMKEEIKIIDDLLVKL